MSFLEVLRAILVILNHGITLDRIAVISDKKGLMSWEDVRNTVLNVMIAHRVKFTLVDRAKVFGANLEDVEAEPETKSLSTGFFSTKMADEAEGLDDEIAVPNMIEPPKGSLSEEMEEEMEEEMALRKSDMEQMESFMKHEAEMDPEMALAVDAVKSKELSTKQVPPSGPPGGALAGAPPPPPPSGIPSLPLPAAKHDQEILKERSEKRKKKKVYVH